MKKIEGQIKWEIFRKQVFPVVLMVLWAVAYLYAVHIQLQSEIPDGRTFLVNLVLLGSLIAKAAIKNDKITQWVIGILFGSLIVIALVGLFLDLSWLVKGALWINILVFIFFDIVDMLSAGVRGSINELENTNIPECHCQSKCLKLGEGESGSKMCSSKEHTEQHVHKNIKNTFFNIIIQRPIQITKNQEENEETLLQKNELCEGENQ